MNVGDILKIKNSGDLLKVIEYVKGDIDIGEEDTALCQLPNGSQDWFKSSEVTVTPNFPVPVAYSWEEGELQGIEIEKNIPIPSGNKKTGKWKLLLTRLEIGDSIKLEVQTNKKRNRVASALNVTAKKLGIAMVVRTISYDPLTIRVWRVK